VAHARKNAQVVAFRSDDRWQPLLAMYHTSIEPAVEQQLAGSQFAMQTLLHKVETIEAPRPNDWPAILQVNTRDDWDKAFGSGE
jgi:molybdopterin-guanine dinucleotide biosynthesis protein A